MLFRAAVSAIVSLAVLLTVYFVQLLSFYCKFEQIKIDWLKIDWLILVTRRVCVPVTTVSSRSALRSASPGHLFTSRTRQHFGNRAFCVTGPAAWNSLIASIRSARLRLHCPPSRIDLRQICCCHRTMFSNSTSSIVCCTATSSCHCALYIVLLLLLERNLLCCL